MKKTLALSLMLCGANVVFAAEVVTQVLTGQRSAIISQNKTTPWSVEDRVCLPREGGKAVCGKVVQTTAHQATVKFDEAVKGIHVGDEIQPETYGETAERTVASETPVAAEALPKVEAVPAAATRPPMYRHILLGANSSFSTTTYHLNFQGYIADHVTLGISPGLFKVANNDVTITTFGAVFTANYYSEQAFRGLWGQFATGFYAFKADDGSITETTFSPAMLGTIGWRNDWALGLNIGVALGVQYITNPQRSSVGIPFNALQPILVTDIGIPF